MPPLRTWVFGLLYGVMALAAGGTLSSPDATCGLRIISWDRFHETHPEYVALQPDGTRSGYPEPNKAKQWLADVAEEIEMFPNRTLFNASPNDSGANGHCVCEN